MTHACKACEATAKGLLLHVRVTPKAASNAVEGLIDHGGRTYLKVRVTAAPEDGKANEAVIAAIAKTLKIPASKLKVAKGASSRLKSILIAEEYADSLYRLLDQLS